MKKYQFEEIVFLLSILISVTAFGFGLKWTGITFLIKALVLDLPSAVYYAVKSQKKAKAKKEASIRKAMLDIKKRV